MDSLTFLSQEEQEKTPSVVYQKAVLSTLEDSGNYDLSFEFIAIARRVHVCLLVNLQRESDPCHHCDEYKRLVQPFNEIFMFVVVIALQLVLHDPQLVGVVEQNGVQCRVQDHPRDGPSTCPLVGLAFFSRAVNVQS